MNGRFRIPGLKSGALHTIVLVLMLIGAIIAYTARSDQPDQVRHVDIVHDGRCTPIVWRAGMDRRGWDLLLEQGYTGSDVALYPPGCEATQ